MSGDLSVFPTVLYFPGNIKDRIEHPLYISNRDDRFAVIRIVAPNPTTYRVVPSNTITVSPKSLQIVWIHRLSEEEVAKKGEGPSAAAAPASSRSDSIVDPHSFHVYGKMVPVKEIYEIPFIGWNRLTPSRLRDLKLKVVVNRKRKPAHVISVHPETDRLGKTAAVVTFPPPMGRAGLDAGEKPLAPREYSQVLVKYGVLAREKAIMGLMYVDVLDDDEDDVYEDARSVANRGLFNKWNLSDLYYMYDEHRVVTKHDLLDELSFVYCPNCCEIKYDGHKYGACCETCSECPMCGCGLQIVKEKKDGGLYYFHCYHCAWNSLSAQPKIVGRSVQDCSEVLLARERKGSPRTLVLKDELLLAAAAKFQRFNLRRKVTRMTTKKRSQRAPQREILSAVSRSAPPAAAAPEKPRSRKQLLVEKDSVSVSELIKRPDPLTRVCSQEAFDYKSLLSASRRRRHPSYVSIEKRIVEPQRKRLLSKKQKLTRREKLLMLKPEHLWDVNHLDFKPNFNAARFLPSCSVLAFDRLALGREGFVHLRFSNPMPSTPVDVQLFQHKRRTQGVNVMLGLPPRPFTLLCKTDDDELMARRIAEQRGRESKVMTKLFLGVRRQNTLVIRVGVTPQVSQTTKKVVKFALKVRVSFVEDQQPHRTDFLVFVRLGDYERS